MPVKKNPKHQCNSESTKEGPQHAQDAQIVAPSKVVAEENHPMEEISRTGRQIALVSQYQKKRA